MQSKEVSVGPAAVFAIITVTLLVTGTRAVAQGNVNGILYASPSGVDLGTQVNSLVSQLPLYNAKPSGTITIPPGTYSYATSIVIQSPYVILKCSPSILNYTGSGEAIKISDAPTSYDGAGGIEHCYLNGTSSATVGVEFNENTLGHIWDTHIQNFTGSGAVGLLIDNTQKWTEQVDLNEVYLLNNTIGIETADNCSGHSGCGSMEYHHYRHVILSVPFGGTGLNLINDTALNHCELDIEFIPYAGSTGLHLQNTSQIALSHVHFVGETSGSVTGILTDSGTLVQNTYWDVNWSSGTWVDTYNGTFIPYVYNGTSDGLSSMSINANGVCLGAYLDNYCDNLDTHLLTSYYATTFPNGNNSPVVTASLTTTSATTQNVAVQGMTSTGHCTLTPTSASAAANIATTWVSAKTANQITVTHAAVANMTYDIICSPI